MLTAECASWYPLPPPLPPLTALRPGVLNVLEVAGICTAVEIQTLHGLREQWKKPGPRCTWRQ